MNRIRLGFLRPGLNTFRRRRVNDNFAFAVGSGQKRTAVTRDFPADELGLRQVAGPKGDGNLDIIAVHGLGADPHKTWSWRTQREGSEYDESTEEVNWLKKLLPKVLPKVQITTFNYASQFAYDAPRDSLRGIATELLSCIHDERTTTDESDNGRTALKSPIIFIGHSFGGYIIQQALVLAAQDKKYNHILLHTSSVFFLGTAHRGTPLATIGVKMGYAATALGTGADMTLMEKLREHSEDIQNIIKDFTIQAREADIDLVCFYEKYKTRIVLKRTLLQSILPSIRTMIVDEESATLPGWRPTGLTTDHSGLNKFQSRNDHNFKLVAGMLKERAKIAVNTITRRIEDGNANKALQRLYFIVPHMRNSTFRPRVYVTKRIESILKEAAQEPDYHQCRVALYGLAGSGKTSRALNLAYSYQGRWNVFWINASTVHTFNNTMTTIGRKIHPAEDSLITSQTDLMMAIKTGWSLRGPENGCLSSMERTTVLLTTWDILSNISHTSGE